MDARGGIVAWLAVVALGCGGPADPDSGTEPDGSAETGAYVRFEVTADGSMAWDAISFPSDLHLGADGRFDLAAPPADVPVWQAAFEVLERNEGFCATCGGWFPVAGEVDPDSVPAPGDLADEPTPADPVVLVEVDPDTPERALHPVDLVWSERRNLLGWQMRGALAPGTRYAVAVTSSLQAVDGSPLGADPLFEEVRDSDSGSPEGDRARPVYRAALDELEAAGVDRGSIVGLAVFTTDAAPDAHVLALADIAAAAAIPTMTIDRVWHRDTGDLDALLGTPVDNRAGFEVPAADGTEGERAARHETTLALVVGHFTSPRIVEGSGSTPGFLLRDAEGRPRAGAEVESVPFMLAIPDVPLADLPVLLYHPGGGGSMLNGIRILTDTAGRHGVAVFAWDAFLHGGRSASAAENGFEARGDDFYPTGYPEGDGVLRPTESGDPVGPLNGFAATDDTRASPEYALAGTSQMMVDTHIALRLLREGDPAPLRAADASLATIAFDPAQLYLSGVSLGANVVSRVLLADEQLAGAILNVGPNHTNFLTCGSWHPEELAAELRTGFMLQNGDRALDIRGTPGPARCVEPNAILFDWYAAAIDPPAITYVRARTRGSAPDLLLQYGADDSLVTHRTAERWLASGQIPAVGSYGPRVIAATPPISANVDGVTVAAYEFPSAGHHLAGVPERTYPPLPGENPVADAHAQIEHFLSTSLAGGRAEIIAP